MLWQSNGDDMSKEKNNETVNKLKIYKYLLGKDTLTNDEFDYVIALSVFCNENNVSCDMLEVDK